MLTITPSSFSRLNVLSVDLERKCDFCRRLLGTPESDDREYGFKCHDCDIDFDRRDRFVAHAAVHTGVKAFFCPHCDRNFSREPRLVVHLERYHTHDTKRTTKAMSKKTSGSSMALTNPLGLVAQSTLKAVTLKSRQPQAAKSSAAARVRSKQRSELSLRRRMSSSSNEADPDFEC